MNILRAFVPLVFAILAPTVAHAGSVASPDGRIVATLDTSGEGTPTYSVSFDGEQVIDPSAIGFIFTDSNPMRRDFCVLEEKTASVDTRWEQPWGERRFVTDRHNELAVTFRQRDAAAREMTVRMRVFDDGRRSIARVVSRSTLRRSARTRTTARPMTRSISEM